MRGCRQGVAVVRAREHADVPPDAGVESGLQVERGIADVRDRPDLAGAGQFHRMVYEVRRGPARGYVVATDDGVDDMLRPAKSVEQQGGGVAIEPGREGGADLPAAKGGESLCSARYCADALGVAAREAGTECIVNGVDAIRPPRPHRG